MQERRDEMVLKGKTKIIRSRHARTQYITIPAMMVADSQYPFNGTEDVEITVDPKNKKISIIAISPESSIGETHNAEETTSGK